LRATRCFFLGLGRSGAPPGQRDNK
jgi:hypothetical protein